MVKHRRKVPANHRPSGSGKSRRDSSPTPPPSRTSKPFWLWIAGLAVVAGGAFVYLQNWRAQVTDGRDRQPAKTEATREMTGVQPAVSRPRPIWDSAKSKSESVWVTDEERLESWNEIDDFSKDGWNSEALAADAMSQLGKLTKRLSQPEPLTSDELQFISGDEIAVGRLIPSKMTSPYVSPDLQIRQEDFSVATALGPLASELANETTRPGASPDERGNAQLTVGRAALLDALNELTSIFSDRTQCRFKIKVFNVEATDAYLLTRQTVEMFGPTPEGTAELNSIWESKWSNDQGTLRLTEVKSTWFELATRPGGTLFSDCTSAVLGANKCFVEQLSKGFDYWIERRQFKMFLGRLGTPGLAVGDVNNDGLPDLYLCQEDGLPNLLLLQQPDGSLADHSAASGSNWLFDSRSALLIDLNNDGNLDLVVAGAGGVVVSQGLGNGVFRYATTVDTDDDVFALSAADYDADGRLDLYAGVYFKSELRESSAELALAGGPSLIYDANQGGRNSLIRNEITHEENSGEHWTFRDVTNDVGLDQNNHRFTLAAGWEDFDNDGDQDLYVANDYGKNNFYRNERIPSGSATFVDVAEEVGAVDANFGMSVAWGDYDQDGWMDLYVSNMYSYAGNRIMFQRQFKPGVSPEVLEKFRRLAKGNTLLRNSGEVESGSSLKFEDRSVPAAVNRGRWAWGSRFVDLNNDSWDDLIVANGYITADDTGDL